MNCFYCTLHPLKNYNLTLGVGVCDLVNDEDY
jgi:hypothetical protein